MGTVPSTPYLPGIPAVAIGDPGSAALVEGLPAMLSYQQPDSMLDAGVVGALTVRAASVRGAGHRYDGTTRQDDFCLTWVGSATGQWFVAVVADGVSAGAQSHLASRAAVRFGSQLVADALAQGGPSTIDWDEIIGRLAGFVLVQARKQSGDESLEAPAAAGIMATTVAFVIVPVDAAGDGTRVCTVVPIGDTSVWVLHGGSWQSVTAIKNEGEAIASSAVFALPYLPTEPVVPLSAVLLPGDAIFAATDGVGDPLGDGDGEVGAALARLWALPPNRYEFAAQVDFGRRSHTDDRTVVGIWPDVPLAGEALPSAASTSTVAAPPAPTAPPAPVEPPAPVDVPPAFEAPPVSTWEPTPWEPTPWQTDDPSQQG